MADLDRPNRYVITASILPTDPSMKCQPLDKVKRALDAGADWVHLDYMDGVFVDRESMGPDVVHGLKNGLGNVFVDAHLMAFEPEVCRFLDAGADMVTLHASGYIRPDRLYKDMAAIKGGGRKAGLAVNPGEDGMLDSPEYASCLAIADMVLFMTVVPGKSGQKFMPEAAGKASGLRKAAPYSGRIQMDGGINPETIRLARDSGADTFVAAAAIFKDENIEANVRALREALEKY